MATCGRLKLAGSLALIIAIGALGSASFGTNPHAPDYHGARFGDLIVGDSASVAGRKTFTRDRSTEIAGVFNAVDCRECHNVPALGGADPFRPFWVIKHDVDGEAATFGRYEMRHGKLVYPFRHPQGRFYLRRPPALFGDGLLEAVPDSELVRIAQTEARETPQHRGRVARLLDGTIGRFGWKADVATLPLFVSSAFLLEIGMDRSQRSRDVASITAYLRDLAAPPHTQRPTLAGARLFNAIGCADCHRPALRIGRFAPAPALSGTIIDPYTDLLLHDMGARNAELRDNAAGPREFRTPPLWGVASTGPPYLHNGVADSLAGAIRRHGGQAADSAHAFERLTPADRATLVEFLRSL